MIKLIIINELLKLLPLQGFKRIPWSGWEFWCPRTERRTWTERVPRRPRTERKWGKLRHNIQCCGLQQSCKLFLSVFIYMQGTRGENGADGVRGLPGNGVSANSNWVGEFKFPQGYSSMPYFYHSYSGTWRCKRCAWISGHQGRKGTNDLVFLICPLDLDDVRRKTTVMALFAFRAVFKWLSKNENQSNYSDQSQQEQTPRWTNHNS